MSVAPASDGTPVPFYQRDTAEAVRTVFADVAEALEGLHGLVATATSPNLHHDVALLFRALVDRFTHPDTATAAAAPVTDDVLRQELLARGLPPAAVDAILQQQAGNPGGQPTA